MTADPLLISNANVIDVLSGEIREADILCVDGRIETIAPSLTRDAPPATTYDAHGGFVIPGLIDAHVHVTSIDFDLGVNDRQAPSWVTARASATMSDMLGRGFTTVRDVGGADHGLVRAQEAGIFEGPRIVHGGPALSQTGGHGDFRDAGVDAEPICLHGVGKIVDGVDEVRRAARDEIRKGARHIKIMASGGVASPTDRVDSTQFSDDEIAAVVEEANAANIYVAAHAYTARPIERCLRMGVRSIEHGNLMEEDTVELFTEYDAFLVPNLAVYRILKREGKKYGQTDANIAKAEVVLEAGLESLEKAYAGGVQIAYGSDFLGPMQKYQSEEFAVRAEVQSSLSIIQSATTIGAKLIGREGDLGFVGVGATADLLVLRRSPLDDINVLGEPFSDLKAVVQSGRIVRCSDTK